MAAPKITLYIDLVSPFAYMAYYVTRHSPVFAKCEITYIPIFLGGLFNATGNITPLRIKNKDKWIDIERKRWAKSLNIPIFPKVPDGFPILTLGVQRTLAALPPAKLIPAYDALYKAFWVEGNAAIGNAETYQPILEAAVGKEVAEEAVRQSSTQAIKDKLSANTTKAFESGGFGVPWFVCTNSKGETEGFWGVDHLGQVAAFLGLDVGGDRGFRALM
ncbi:hypothetical protein FQN55_000976 [Onygenales sp. PD_40]|nr:hypothetical protein FQN55_000976 [Onygenales sp. PD_40]